MSETSTTSHPASGQPSAETPKTGGSGGGSAAKSALTGAALWAALFAIAVWIAFSIVLIVKAGTNETEWTRIAWVFGSIQAVAFAAAGALFGTSIQQQSVNNAQQNVNNAKQEAASAKQEADQHRNDATKGRALAAVMQAEAVAQPTAGADGAVRMGTGDAPSADSADALRQSHAQLSRALFGDLV